jgi:integrase/recombinase XerC
MLDNSKMIASFFSYLQFEKRYSPHTILSYQTDLQQLSSYLHSTYQIADWHEASYQMLRSWLLHLAGENKKSRSVARKVACIKSLYKFLYKHGHVNANHAAKLTTPKLEKRLPTFVEEKNMVVLLDQLSFPEGFAGLRDKLVIELFYGTGIRLSELIGIKHSDYNRYDKTLRVTGKGNKERIIPINKSLEEMLATYYSLKQSQFELATEHLLVTDNGSKLYPVYVQRLVKKYLSQVSTVDKKSPHVLRHTFATHLLNKGADLNAIKEMLGHSSLAATQVYTHNSLEKLKQAFKKAHPKA